MATHLQNTVNKTTEMIVKTETVTKEVRTILKKQD